jgi:CHASE3 domain sensor protein
MVNFSTIKGKLTALAVITFISYVTLAYLAYSNNKDAQKTAERMILLGEIRTHTNGAMMDLRGFQLLYDEKFVAGYTEHNQKLQKSIEELSSITRSKENKERLAQIADHHKGWQELNEPRIKIINENENLIHDPEFISSADDYERIGRNLC